MAKRNKMTAVHEFGTQADDWIQSKNWKDVDHSYAEWIQATHKARRSRRRSDNQMKKYETRQGTGAWSVWSLHE